MSREIKFRAWHTPFGKQNKSLNRYLYGNKVISLHDMSPDKYELEQYTGFKDVNGYAVYEGDVLRDVDDNVIVGYVCWDDVYGGWGMDSGVNSLFDVIGSTEVIGNTHKNPELLEETK